MKRAVLCDLRVGCWPGRPYNGGRIRAGAPKDPDPAFAAIGVYYSPTKSLRRPRISPVSGSITSAFR